MIQNEFKVIKDAEEMERRKAEERSRTADLEASVHLANEKIAMKEKQLEEK
jgi:hypothetical protein